MIPRTMWTLNTRQAYVDSDTGYVNICWQASILMISLFALTLILWCIDQRQLDNASTWAKPLKFEASLAIYFMTLAYLAARLPDGIRSKATWRWATRLAVAAGIFEITYILLQAARGRASHYNNDTMIEAVMYGAMGIGAVTLVAVSFYLGWLLYREYRKQQADIVVLAAAHGLLWGSVLTLITAGIMSSGESHFAGTPAVDAMRVPIVGWVLSGGDLRIPHFFATHLMQLLSIYGLILWRKNIEMLAARRRVMYFLWVYCLLVLFGLFTSFSPSWRLWFS